MKVFLQVELFVQARHMRRGYAAECVARWSALVARGARGAQGAQGARKRFNVYKNCLICTKTNQEIDVSFRGYCFG